MKANITKTVRFWEMARRAVAFAAIAIVLTEPGVALSGTIEQLAGTTLSLEERTRLTCPEPDAPGPFAVPVEIGPSPKMAVWVTYSEGDDLVRLAGADTEVEADLGGGDDIALLYDIGAGLTIYGGIGADTVLLCSMSDVAALIVLGPKEKELIRDADRDVVVIESSIFSTVPTGYLRIISIHSFDKDTDRLIVYAPAQMLQSKQASILVGGIRIGEVLIRIGAPIGAEQVNYDEESIILIPAGL